jgi:hypothetical protein
MKELMRHVVDNKIPLSKVMLVNEMAISGKSEKQVWDFIDQVTEVMMGMVNTGLKTEGVLPGPIKLQSKAATVFKRAQSSGFETDRAIAMVSAAALAASEENRECSRAHHRNCSNRRVSRCASRAGERPSRLPQSRGTGTSKRIPGSGGCRLLVQT